MRSPLVAVRAVSQAGQWANTSKVGEASSLMKHLERRVATYDDRASSGSGALEGRGRDPSKGNGPTASRGWTPASWVGPFRLGRPSPRAGADL